MRVVFFQQLEDFGRPLRRGIVDGESYHLALGAHVPENFRPPGLEVGHEPFWGPVYTIKRGEENQGEKSEEEHGA